MTKYYSLPSLLLIALLYAMVMTMMAQGAVNSAGLIEQSYVAQAQAIANISSADLRTQKHYQYVDNPVNGGSSNTNKDNLVIKQSKCKGCIVALNEVKLEPD